VPQFASDPRLLGAPLHWPKWVPHRYDACVLFEVLKAKAMVLLAAKMPDEPAAASYYVAKNLILDNRERMISSFFSSFFGLFYSNLRLHFRPSAPGSSAFSANYTTH
jgi:hypothetical protein